MEILYIGSIFCAIVTAMVLIRTKTLYQAFSDNILAAFLITSAFCAAAYILIISGKIVETPHLFKLAAPLNFLLPPLTYFYVRSVLKNENRFKKTDWFHFIPFFIVFLNYLPFYLSTAQQKIFIIKEVGIENWEGTGFINELFQFICREGQAFIYLIFQWKLLLAFIKKENKTSTQKHTKKVIKWLLIFNLVISIDFICISFSAILVSTIPSGSWTPLFLNLSDIIFGGGYFVLCSYLLLNPSVLYGFPFLIEKELNQHPPSNTTIKNITDQDQLLLKLIEHFSTEFPFLKKNYSITQLSIDLNTSPRNISFLLNSHLKMRFTDYVNNYRIEYSIQKLEENYLDHFTLESLAKESGFSTYRTFQRAFQKKFQMNPLEYVENLKKRT